MIYFLFFLNIAKPVVPPTTPKSKTIAITKIGAFINVLYSVLKPSPDVAITLMKPPFKAFKHHFHQ